MTILCRLVGHRWRRMRGGYGQLEQCERCRAYRPRVVA